MTLEPDSPLQRAIREHLQRTGETARALSLRIGRNETLVRRILDGTVSAPRGDNLARLAQALGVSMDTLQPSAGVAALDPAQAVAPALEQIPLEPRAPGAVNVPVYGVAAGGADGAFTVNLSDAPLDYAARPPMLRRAADIFAVTIQGDSMEPVWRAGDLVYCQGRRGYGPGDYILVQLDAAPGEVPLAFLKRLVRQDNGNVVLAQHNPPAEMTIPRGMVRAIYRAFHWRELGL